MLLYLQALTLSYSYFFFFLNSKFILFWRMGNKQNKSSGDVFSPFSPRPLVEFETFIRRSKIIGRFEINGESRSVDSKCMPTVVGTDTDDLIITTLPCTHIWKRYHVLRGDKNVRGAGQLTPSGHRTLAWRCSEYKSLPLCVTPLSLSPGDLSYLSLPYHSPATLSHFSPLSVPITPLYPVLICSWSVYRVQQCSGVP